VDYLSLVHQLLNRSDTTHKGDVGRVGIVAGSSSMLGAALLTSLATLRSGSGLVYLYSCAESKTLLTAIPELIIEPILHQDSVSDLALLERCINQHHLAVLACGPGLGVSDYTLDMVQGVCLLAKKYKLPLVLDADALNGLDLNCIAGFHDQCIVLTPHAGEFQRLFPQSKIGDLNADNEFRQMWVKQVAESTNQVIVLKGHQTLIAVNDASCINASGNPAMATAGMGDVLTGMIASFIGQGMDCYQAACLAVYLHGLAGDEREKELSISLCAHDIIDFLPTLFKNISKYIEKK